jgi:hypothetical protein
MCVEYEPIVEEVILGFVAFTNLTSVCIQDYVGSATRRYERFLWMIVSRVAGQLFSASLGTH